MERETVWLIRFTAAVTGLVIAATVFTVWVTTHA